MKSLDYFFIAVILVTGITSGFLALRARTLTDAVMKLILAIVAVLIALAMILVEVSS